MHEAEPLSKEAKLLNILQNPVDWATAWSVLS